MTMELQLDLFEKPLDEVTLLRMELKQVRESSEKVRRGIFARHNELAKMYVELKEKIEKNI